MNTADKPIFLPDGHNTIHDGIEHEPTGGKGLIGWEGVPSLSRAEHAAASTGTADVSSDR
jgi:hypothetical protein